MDLEVTGKTFIVTGGTDGLGLATARALLAEGAKVLISGRTEGKLPELKAAVGDRIAYVKGNNADPELPDRLRVAVLERWGQLDGLLLSVGGPPASRALETDDETWRSAFESVFLGTVRLIRDLSPTIRDGGAVLMILATSAKEASPTLTISNGLRPGLAMLTKSFAAELGPRAIRVNALLPNLFATDRLKQLLGDETLPVDNVALRRMGDPDELARVATVLLSSVSSYVTGTAVAIDGGQLRSL